MSQVHQRCQAANKDYSVLGIQNLPFVLFLFDLSKLKPAILCI